jgi:hypothetical protein
LKEQLNQIINTLALIAYYIPLLVVLYKKLGKDMPVLMFACYWALGGFINCLGSASFVPLSAFEVCRLVFNMIDLPFILYIFFLNTRVEKLRSLIKIIIPVYLFVEIMNGLFRGFNDNSFKYLVGVGVFTVITLVLMEIFYYFRKLDHTPREKAISFLFLAVLFEYAVYVYYYVYEYFVPGDHKTDMQIIYYASTLIGIIIACFGFFAEGLKKKRPQPQAPRQHEVLINIID